MTHGLKFHIVTEAERAEQRKDTRWHKVHSFLEGYSWRRYSDDAIVPFVYIWKNVHEDAGEFLRLPVERQEQIAAECKRIQDEELAWRRAHPVKIGDLTSVTIPKVTGGQGVGACINDIVGVQPMTAPRKP
jgi:hypothetical protein